MDSQITQFCFTAFPKINTPESLEDLLITIEKSLQSQLTSHFFIIGREICPSSGRLHLQGFSQLAKKKRVSTIRKHIRGNVTHKLKGSVQQNIDYCSKEKNFSRWGTPTFDLHEDKVQQAPRDKKWKELIACAKEGRLNDALNEHPGPALIHWTKLKGVGSHFRTPVSTLNRRCVWIWSTKSGTGKSRFCHNYFPHAFWIMNAKFFQGYRPEDHDAIIYDDIDTDSKGELRTIKRMSDIYPCLLDVKFGDVSASYTRFIITSNYMPEDIWYGIGEADPIYRRFLVVEAVEWDDQSNDLKVKKKNREFMLGSYLLERNFF